MILDSQLNWKEHVKHLTRKLARDSWAISTKKVCRHENSDVSVFIAQFIPSYNNASPAGGVH